MKNKWFGLLLALSFGLVIQSNVQASQRVAAPTVAPVIDRVIVNTAQGNFVVMGHGFGQPPNSNQALYFQEVGTGTTLRTFTLWADLLFHPLDGQSTVAFWIDSGIKLQFTKLANVPRGPVHIWIQQINGTLKSNVVTATVHP